MKKAYQYNVIVTNLSGEIENFIITNNINTNQFPNIIEVTSKLYNELSQKGLNPLEWSIIKIEKIEEDLSTHNLDNISNIKIKNLTNVNYLLNFNYIEGELVLTLYTKNHFYNPSFTNIMSINSYKSYDITDFLINNVLTGNDIDKIFIINELPFNKSVYIKQVTLQDGNRIIIIMDEENPDEDKIEIKPHNCKQVYIGCDDKINNKCINSLCLKNISDIRYSISIKDYEKGLLISISDILDKPVLYESKFDSIVAPDRVLSIDNSDLISKNVKNVTIVNNTVNCDESINFIYYIKSDGDKNHITIEIHGSEYLYLSIINNKPIQLFELKKNGSKLLNI